MATFEDNHGGKGDLEVLIDAEVDAGPFLFMQVSTSEDNDEVADFFTTSKDEAEQFRRDVNEAVDKFLKLLEA